MTGRSLARPDRQKVYPAAPGGESGWARRLRNLPAKPWHPTQAGAALLAALQSIAAALEVQNEQNPTNDVQRDLPSFHDRLL